MFTGLIESTGEVLEVQPIEAGFRIRVRTRIGQDLLEGESVAVNGVCLTAIDTRSGELRAEIGPETARVTTLGLLTAGSTVNLERAIRADGRLGGCGVRARRKQGHEREGGQTVTEHAVLL